MFPIILLYLIYFTFLDNSEHNFEEELKKYQTYFSLNPTGEYYFY